MVNSKPVPAEGSTQTKTLERADIGDRIIAFLIDGVLITIPLFYLAKYLIPSFVIGTIVQLVGGLAYFAVFAYFKNGQTIGKQIKGIKVVTLNGDSLNLWQFLWREFMARGIMRILELLYFGPLTQAWLFTYTPAALEEKRALHDFIAKTQVVYVNKRHI